MQANNRTMFVVVTLSALMLTSTTVFGVFELNTGALIVGQDTTPLNAEMEVAVASARPGDGDEGLLDLDGVARAFDFADGESFESLDDEFSKQRVLYAGVDTDGDFDDDTFVQTIVLATEKTVTVEVSSQGGGNGSWSLRVTLELGGTENWALGEIGSFKDIMDFVPDLDAENPGEIVDKGEGLAATPGAYVLVVNNPFWMDLFDPEKMFDETWTDSTGLYELSLVQPPGCPEDLDESGAVDIGDILAILSAWGNAGGPEDLDGSGTVDVGDLLIVLEAWGPCA